MNDWIRFEPSKKYIGLRAMFRKVIAGIESEETVGTIVGNPDPYPWHHDVAIKREEDKTLLYFSNGSCPFYQNIDGKKCYMGTEFEVEYYYKEIR